MLVLGCFLAVAVTRVALFPYVSVKGILLRITGWGMVCVLVSQFIETNMHEPIAMKLFTTMLIGIGLALIYYLPKRDLYHKQKEEIFQKTKGNEKGVL